MTDFGVCMKGSYQAIDKAEKYMRGPYKWARHAVL